jgi:hypothetical protein
MRHYAPGKSVRPFSFGLTETLSCFKNSLAGDRTDADVWRRCQFARSSRLLVQEQTWRVNKRPKVALTHFWCSDRRAAGGTVADSTF